MNDRFAVWMSFAVEDRSKGGESVKGSGSSMETPFVVLLANVGGSDVQISNVEPLQRAGFHFPAGLLERPRSDGRALWESYDEVKEGIDAPILRAVIEFLESVYERIDLIVLFCTDQPKPKVQWQVERYWEKDTIYFGKILAHWLPDRFQGKIGKVKVQTIQGNPAVYDEMHEFFEKTLPKVMPEGAKWVLLSLAGGTPASNMALLLNSLKIFRHRCQCLYSLQDGRVLWLNISEAILKDFTLEQARILLDRHDYWALSQLMEKAGIGELWAHHFCRAIVHRLYMDFEEAQRHVRAAMSMKSHPVLSQWDEQLRALSRPPFEPSKKNLADYDWSKRINYLKHLLAENFWGMELKAQIGEWADFLARWSNLMEATLVCLFESVAEFPARQVRAWIEKQQRLPQWLKSCPSLFVTLRTIIEVWAQDGVTECQQVINWIKQKQFEKLDELRDKSVVGHGARAINKETIEKVAGRPVNDLVIQMRTLLETLFSDVPEIRLEENPFLAAQQVLREHLSLR